MKNLFRLLYKIILLIGITVVLLCILNKQYAKTIENRYADTFKFQYIPEHIMLSNVGSSHAEYGLQYDDSPAFSNVSHFNFALASQPYDYDLALLKMYQNNLEPGGVLLIPVSYFSFNDEVTNDTEKEAMEVRYYSFLKPEYIPNYSLYTDIITQKLPILSADEDLLTWITSTLFPSLEVHAEGEGLTIEEAMEKAQSRYDRHFLNKDNYFYQERISELKDIILFCQERKITPILISIPVTRYYHDLISDDFFTDFYQHIDEICKETNVTYYDYSYDDRFRGNLSYFNDSDHLNADGSKAFLTILGQEIPEIKKIIGR